MTDRGSISKRAAAVQPSATLAITTRAKELRAQGLPVIGFGAGEPDFPTPPAIVDAAVRAASDPKSHKYTPAAGQPALREAIAAKTLRDSGFAVESSQVVVTNGGKHAVYQTCQVLIDPGDEVLLPSPYWVSYPEAVALAGGRTVTIPTDETTNFTRDGRATGGCRHRQDEDAHLRESFESDGVRVHRGSGPGRRRVGG